MTPKGMRLKQINLAGGGAMHLYSSNGQGMVLQMRRSVPTEIDVMEPAFKVALRLNEQEALALAAELLLAASRGIATRIDPKTGTP